MADYFRIKERGTTFRREVVAGIATFLTMAYIIVVNPQFLAAFGDPAWAHIALPISASVTATCLAAGVICIAMGIFANFPLALASGMGLNAMALALAQQLGGFPTAMGVFVIEGLIIAILVLTKFRPAVMNAIPMPLKHAIAAGIGLFLTLIGLKEGGIIVPDPNTMVSLGNLVSFPVLCVVLGVIITGVLMARRVPGGILLGILFSTVLATVANYIAGFSADGKSILGFAPCAAVLPCQVISMPDFSTIGQFNFDIFQKLSIVGAILTIFSIMLSDFFDTMGTVVSVGDKSGLMDTEGNIHNLNRILLVDSLAASVGGAMSASSVTSYIESTAGVASGGRTGIMPIVVGVCFLLAIFIHPVVTVIPLVATVPALIIVGFLMVGLIRQIEFEDWDTGLPAFLTIIVMPLAYSITDGIGVGFVTYTFLKMLGGKFRQVHPLMYVVTAGFLVYFILPALL